jgi:Na+:H+ antiporter, NhaA family
MRSANRSLPKVAATLAEFLREEALSGALLLLASAAALVWANVSGGEGYTGFWHQTLTLGAGGWAITEDLQHWVNDGLMTVFFFAVGLEIKRELAVGELRSRRVAALPALAAAGGVVLPIAIFLALVGSGPAREGWGIPMATDIAFAAGVLALLGRFCTAGARLFLLAIAIVDDVLAVLVIAVFYSGGVDWRWLALAAMFLAAILLMRRLRIPWAWAYVPAGVALWGATLESGVHATIAGVVLGLITPARPVRGRPVLERLEHGLHPVSAFFVVPVFALANAGVYLGGGLLREAATARLTWAVAVGLAAGKVLGIGAATHLARRAGWARLPGDMEPREVWGIGALCGIGFTVSLFVTDLAFSDPALIGRAKVGLFAGSLVSVLLGTALLALAPTRGHLGVLQRRRRTRAVTRK